MLKQPADDLFEKSSMSFGEHLDELRRALTKAFICLGIGTILGLSFAESLVKFVQTPLEAAVYEFRIAQAKHSFEEANGVPPSEELADFMIKYGQMPERIFADPNAFQAASEASRPSLGSGDADLSDPWSGVKLEQMKRLRPILLWRPINTKLHSFAPIEGFMIWLKAGLVAGVVIGSPGIFWFIWQFFAAGLYPHERRYVYWYLPLSLLLFLSGVGLAFFAILKLVIGFLITYTVDMNVEFTPRLNDYMSFVLFLPLGFGIAFQLPIVMLGLHRFGVLTVETYVAQWRMALLVIAFLSMVLTPSDPYTMMGLFIPLSLLYFFGIFLCKFMPKGAGIGSPAIDP